MNELNPFSSQLATRETQNAAADSDLSRAIAETQAAMIIAKRFPRDPVAVTDRILNACARPGLAESALYSYARGGKDITGPSIRLAEAIAQEWGNLTFGIRELEQRNGESTVESFAWDMEKNTKEIKTFQVKHERTSKKGGITKLTDSRDIYEMTANQGARRLRACILGVIPGDVIEAAVQQCETTLKTQAEVTPESIAAVIEKFSSFGVSKEQIEKRLQRHMNAMMPAQLVQLRKIYNSLKDGMSAPEDWFETAETPRTVKKPVFPPEGEQGNAPPQEVAPAEDVPSSTTEEREREESLQQRVSDQLVETSEEEFVEAAKKLFGKRIPKSARVPADLRDDVCQEIIASGVATVMREAEAIRQAEESAK